MSSSTEAGPEPADRYATVNGLAIHYLEWRARGLRPLILLHGIARVAHTFDHVAAHFSGRHLGGASTIVPAGTQARLKQLLPQVEIVTMPGLGHYPVDEDPPGFLAIVDRFLEKNLRKS